MKALKRNVENLQKVANRICEVPFSSGLFRLDFATDDSVILISDVRNCIGSAIISYIPSNWNWSVTFEDDCLKLYIWI